MSSLESFHGYSSDSAFEVIYPDIPISFPSLVRFASVPAKPFYPSAYQYIPETRAKTVKVDSVERDDLTTTIAPIIEATESQRIKVVRPNEMKELMKSHRSNVHSVLIGKLKNKSISNFVDLVNRTIAKQEKLVRHNKTAEGWDYMIGTVHKSLYLFMLPKQSKDSNPNYVVNLLISL